MPSLIDRVTTLGRSQKGQSLVQQALGRLGGESSSKKPRRTRNRRRDATRRGGGRRR